MLFVFVFYISSQLCVALSTVSKKSQAVDKNAVQRDDIEWWKKYPIYQIYPMSFKDSNGDGVGDIKGIVQKIGYLEQIGIKVVWLNPVYVSPMVDNGYDVSDYREIDPRFGTMADFEKLVDEIHRRGMYLIVDFVPNHTSEKHAWFIESRKSRNNSYADYYIWRDARHGNISEPPNNWLSILGRSAWTWSPERKQFYFHNYRKEQPDLNYRSARVQAEIKKLLIFWLLKGVDGFRFDAVHHLVEDELMRDEPLIGPTGHKRQPHIYTVNQPMNYAIVASWVRLTAAFGRQRQKTIATLVEVHGDRNQVMKYYDEGVSFPFNFYFTNMYREDLRQGDIAAKIRSTIGIWTPSARRWPDWLIGSHGERRYASRLGGRMYTDVGNMLLLLLPGTPTCYYGDELGLLGDHVIASKLKVDRRSPGRTPMPWNGNAAENFGFSSTKKKTWLPIDAAEATEINVERQLRLAARLPQHLGVFRDLVRLRAAEAVFWKEAGNLVVFDSKYVSPADVDVVCFARYERPTTESNGTTIFVVALSFAAEGASHATVDVAAAFADRGFAKPTASSIVLKSTAASAIEDERLFGPESGKIQLVGGQGIVIRFFSKIEH